MNKKGFTLTELIAILVIISIVALIAVPAVINSIKNNNHDSYNGVVNDIILVSETYAANMGASIVQVSVETLKQAGYLPTDLKNPIDNTNFNGCVYVVNGDPIYKEETCSTIIRNVDGVRLYKDGVLNGLDPVLDTGLIPVTIADDGTVTKASLATEWYNYTEKKWANAVILKGSDNYLEGQTIPESEIDAYFVWIPKFKYKLFDMGNYTNTSGSSKPANSNAKTIDIVFDPVNTTDSDTSCATPLTSGGSGNCAVDKYMTHPAFITMNVNGLWVGKYEVSGTTSNLEVKPNAVSLRSTTVGDFFTSMYNYNRDLDSHMMKNTEWGAVAYLSLSNYGINGEVRINNDSTYHTGCAATVANTSNIGVSQSNHTEGYYAGCENAYNTSIGYLASTTGNITGIYDMSGGAYEYVAGYISGNIGNSGLTVSDYSSKYFDVYNASSSANSYNYRILGDAIGEMGPFYYYSINSGGPYYVNNWYEDFSTYFVDSSKPWISRGSSYGHGVAAGQLNFSKYTGAANAAYSARLVLAPKQAVEEPSNDAPVNTCEYAVNDDWTFDYTGDIQNFTVPCTGTYKLEVWGGQGSGAGGYSGGRGGYSTGVVELTKDSNIYVVVGGAGRAVSGGSAAGGYNGGGTARSRNGMYTSGSGGGATHIATELIDTGVLSKYSNNTDKILLVAGGGGGGAHDSGTSSYGGSGGCGGGTNGCGASGKEGSSSGGSQTGAGSSGSFGQGANACYDICPGAGGGWYGGGCPNHDNNPAAGGSGYIGGVTDGQTLNGNTAMPTHDGTSTMTGNTGNGYAKITLISY